MHLNTRRAVLLGLLVAQIAMVGALMAVSGRLSERAESTHTDALLDTATAEAVDQLRAHLAPAESIVDLMSRLGADVTDPFSVFNNTFLEALQRTPQLDGVYIGTSDGGFTYTSRNGDGYLLKSITVTNDGTKTNLQYMDSDGKVTAVADDAEDDFDPRTRVWYSEATKEVGQVVWTDPYVFFTSQMLGITAAQTIERDGDVVGVIGADIELGSLSEFLGTLNVGERGGSIIVNQAGTAIAHNDATLLQVETNGGFRTVNIDEVDDPTSRAAVATLAETMSDKSAIMSFESSDYGAGRAAFRWIPVGSGRWTVGVYGPEDNFTGVLSEARSRERWLILGVGALTALLLFGLIALPATRPISELEVQANTDSLTQLPNRRTTMALAKDATASDQPVALAMIDVDNFKTVNDTRGHQSGDQVLRVVARRIQSAVRGSSIVGRIGGEEFLVIFPDTEPESALAACERIRETIQASPISTRGHEISVTASIGIAATAGRGDVAGLMEIADEALRQAKVSGKNQIQSRIVDVVPGHDPESNDAATAPERI